MGTTVRQMRLNPLNGRWVTIVAERADRPSDFAPRDRTRETTRSAALPVLPRQRGRQHSRAARHRRRGRRLADAGHPQPLPGVRRCQRASSCTTSDRSTSPPTPPACTRCSSTRPCTTPGCNDLERRPCGELMQALKRRLTEHAATAERPLHAGDRQPRPRGRRIARPPARPDPRPAVRADARSSTRNGPSPASPAAASSAPRSTPRRPPATVSCSPTTTSCASHRSGAVRPTSCC